MAQGYWDAEKAGEEACFTMYFRDYPFKEATRWPASMAQLADLVGTFRFSEEDIAYLASLDAPAGGPLFDPAFWSICAICACRWISTRCPRSCSPTSRSCGSPAPSCSASLSRRRC